MIAHLFSAVVLLSLVIMVVLTESYSHWHRTWLPAFVLGLISWVGFAVVTGAFIYVNAIHADDGSWSTNDKAIGAIVLLVGLAMVTYDVRKNWRRRKDAEEQEVTPPRWKDF